jgi:nicotinamidase-related amidase
MTAQTDTALLVIDVQESFRQRNDDWAAMANPAVLENISRLVDHARTVGDEVVWVTHAEPGSGGAFDPASGFVEVMSELEPRSSELHVTKSTINAFTSTDLQQLLEQRGIRRVVISGIRTEQCCETTARIASDLGFDVDFVTDATTTSSIAAGATHAAVSGEDLMRRTESVLAARGFATIVRTDERVGAAATV